MVQQLERVIVAPIDGKRMTYDEYVAWMDEDERHIGEWVDGEVIEFMPAGFPHQSTIGFLYMLLAMHSSRHGLGEVVLAPFPMKLFGGRSYRLPDIVFIATASAARRTDEWLDGGADLAIEVVSPSSVQRDRRDKLTEYAAAGVQEYWIVDPRPGRAPFTAYRLDADEGYLVPAALDARGLYMSAVLPGLEIDPNWFAGGALPNVTTILRARGLLD